MGDAGPETVADPPAARTATPAPSAESWARRSFGSALHLIVATGLVGVLVTTYFQWLSASYQDSVAKIGKDADAALGALHDLDAVIGAEWISTYQLNDALKTKAGGDALKSFVDRFHSANTMWEQQHEILSAELEMSVDDQFGVDQPDALGEGSPVWSLGCTTKIIPLRPTGAPSSMPLRVMLEVSYHCHDLIETDIEDQLQGKAIPKCPTPTIADGPECDLVRLGHVWWIEKVLQCMMVERATAIRNTTARAPFLSFFTSPQSPRYTPEQPTEKRCLDDYEK